MQGKFVTGVLNQVPQESCQSKTGDAANARKTEVKVRQDTLPPPPSYATQTAIR